MQPQIRGKQGKSLAWTTQTARNKHQSRNYGNRNKENKTKNQQIYALLCKEIRAPATHPTNRKKGRRTGNEEIIPADTTRETQNTQEILQTPGLHYAVKPQRYEWITSVSQTTKCNQEFCDLHVLRTGLTGVRRNEGSHEYRRWHWVAMHPDPGNH